MYGGQSGKGEVLIHAFRCSLVNYHSINTPYNIHLFREPGIQHQPNLVPKEVWEQKFHIIPYCELPQPSIYRQKWRCLHIGVGPLSAIDVVLSYDTDDTSTRITKDKGTTNSCYISHRQLLNEIGITTGVTSFASTKSPLSNTGSVLSESVSIHALPKGPHSGNLSASSQSLTRSTHFLAARYQLHSSLNTRSTCSYTVHIFYPCCCQWCAIICCGRGDDKREFPCYWLTKCDFSLNTPRRHVTLSTDTLILNLSTDQLSLYLPSTPTFSSLRVSKQISVPLLVSSSSTLYLSHSPPTYCHITIF
jgi:hypothetical protein